MWRGPSTLRGPWPRLRERLDLFLCFCFSLCCIPLCVSILFSASLICVNEVPRCIAKRYRAAEAGTMCGFVSCISLRGPIASLLATDERMRGWIRKANLGPCTGYFSRTAFVDLGPAASSLATDERMRGWVREANWGHARKPFPSRSPADSFAVAPLKATLICGE